MAFAMLLVVLPATAASASPTYTKPMPSQVDLIDAYQGQSLCDPSPKVGTLALRDLLWQTYGRSIWAGISRDCDVSWDRGISEHKDGRAIDWGVSVRDQTKALGDDFVNWATANNGENARRLGIMYLIWDSKMWRLYDMGRGWTEYQACLTQWTSTSYDTSCHRDHVHISLTWHGAGAETSGYSGSAVTQAACTAGDPILVPPGAPDAPTTLFDPLAGKGVPNGRSCYLGSGVQTLKVPIGPDSRQTVQRIRVTQLQSNAPSPVRIWSSVSSGLRAQVPEVPAEYSLAVGADGLIYIQQPVGQSTIRIEGLGQSLPIAAGQILQVPVVGPSTNVPADAKAVAVNLTVTEPLQAGFLRVFPCGVPMPPTSNLNFNAGETTANSAIVGVGTDSSICISSSAVTHIVVDFSGYFPTGSNFTPTSPTRMVDTRTSAKPVSGSDVVMQLPDGAAAAAVSLAVTQPEGSGWISAYPCGQPFPGTSTVNFVAGVTVAGGAIVQAGEDNRVCVRTLGRTHVIADLMGVFTSRSDFTAMAPVRIADTRVRPGFALQAGAVLALTPPSAAPTVGLNVAVTQPSGAGWIQAFPCGSPPVAASTVNFSPGETVANAALVGVGSNGQVCLRSMTTTHVVVDQTAAYGDTIFRSLPPMRLLDTRNG